MTRAFCYQLGAEQLEVLERNRQCCEAACNAALQKLTLALDVAEKMFLLKLGEC